MKEQNEPLTKIITTSDAHAFLIQNAKIKNHRTIDHFYILYLNGKNHVLGFRIVAKRNKDSLTDSINQIINTNQQKEVFSLLIFHQPASYIKFDQQKEIANEITDRAFFAHLNVIDYVILYTSKYYESMYEMNNPIINKHLKKIQNTVRIDEQSEYSTQDLFDMDIKQLENLIRFECNRIFSLDSFLCFEIVDQCYEEYMNVRFDCTRYWNLEKPLTKTYLVSVLNDYERAKKRILTFVVKLNLYEKYLSYLFDFDSYHKQREQTKSTTPIPHDVCKSVKISINIFTIGQKVMINSHAKINGTLPYGIKKGSIYLVDEIQSCQCGNNLLVLSGTFDSEVKSRICSCGNGGFHPNAFNSLIFQPVSLEIVR